jgi:4-amino-4-deoxy-L-arabinose transferase-like glycosyltransferase
MISDSEHMPGTPGPLGERLRFYLILAAFAVFNLWHSHAMGLCHDEAYYWVYSRFLAWGYFDHPPMVALAIALGRSLIAGELGVRLIFIAMELGAIILAWRMTNRRDALLFWVIVLSLPLLQVGGTLALPDMPLVFFGTLFLVIVRRYIERDGLAPALALGVAAALMLYSKYHGILVIGFTLAAAPGLLKRKSFWIAAGLTVLLFAPHIVWQARNDFVSIRFQLSRAPDFLNAGLILEYLAGQVGSAGLLSGLVLLYVLIFKFRPADTFERVLRLNATGILAFFLVMSLKGKVEANWTQVAFIPLALIGHSYLQHKRRLRKWTMLLALIPIVLIIAVRLIFVFPPENSRALRRAYEFHDWPDITLKVTRYAGDLPVVARTYPHAASLSFYSGRIVPAINLGSRDNQFTLWKLERAILDRQVCYVSGSRIPGAYMIETRQGDRLYLIRGMTVPEIRRRFGR